MIEECLVSKKIHHKKRHLELLRIL